MHLPLVACFVVFFASCNGQKIGSNQNQQNTSVAFDNNELIGGGCDGCEIMFIGMSTNITSVDTSAGWNEIGKKLLVSGTVYKIDGITPVPNVIIYYWQTDNTGHYTATAGMDEKAKRHGHLRGWVRTAKDGKFSIYTIRPAPYPNEVLPAHIHFVVKEPGLSNEYYIDDLNFKDDRLLIPYSKINPFDNRGGSGVVNIIEKNELQIAERNIVLGLNIPNYK